MDTQNQPMAVGNVSEAVDLAELGRKGTLQLGQLGVARVGDVWPDSKGQKRLILSIAADRVIFVAKDQVYAQTYNGFTHDVGFAVIKEKTAEGMAIAAALIETTLAFLEGFVKAMGWPLLVVFTGKDVVAFLITHQKDIPKWLDASKQIHSGFQDLLRYSPTLCTLLIEEGALDAVQRIHTATPVMMGPKDTAKLAGGVLGMGRYNLSIVKDMVFGLLSFFAKVGTTAVKTIGPVVRKQYADPKELSALVSKIRKRAVSEGAAQKVYQEYRAHPSETKAALEKLKKGFDTLVTTLPRAA